MSWVAIVRAGLLAAACAALGPSVARAEPAGVPVSAPAAIPLGQLGDDVRPTAYRLDLTLDPSRARFSGKVEIDVAVARGGLTSLFLHGRGLAMHRAAVTAGGRTFVGRWSQVDPAGVARLDFPEALPPGPATLAFDYDAPFAGEASGLFHLKVGGDWYVWSQFESIDARAAFPGFDQPGFKTPFTVTLRTPPGLTAISNAPETGTASEGGLTVHHFAPTAPLPTYLVATMVGPFASVVGAAAPSAERPVPLPLRVLSPRPNGARLGFALANTAPIVTRLEDYFGSPFPFPKLDQITAPGAGGAMENAGAVLYEDNVFVLGSDASGSETAAFGEYAAHELAHQWFGDLVTPVWWDDIWLNESFANWLGYRVADAWRPDLGIKGAGIAEGFAAMDTDALIAGRPIRQRVATGAEADSTFDVITYGKGGHVLAMIAGFMGDAAFRSGVRGYIAAHRGGSATSDDFFAALGQAAGSPRIVDALRSFTDQQGVPLLTFSGKGAQLHVTQGRYAAYGETMPAQTWIVPLCVRRGAPRTCTLLSEASADIAVPGKGALVPNAGGTGYYRFELPRRDWDALIGVADVLAGGEAQALADSLTASVRAGRSDVAMLARLARYLAQHPDSHASDAAMEDLAALAQDMVSDPAAREAWQRYLGRIYVPLIAQYGFDPRVGAYADEPAERSAHRRQIVDRLLFSDRDLVARPRLVAAAAAYLGGDTAALDPAYLRLALSVHVQAAGIDGAKRLMEQALASEDAQFRPAALVAIASSGRGEIADWLLDFDDPRLRLAERRDILAGLFAASGTRHRAYTRLQSRPDALIQGSSGVFFARLPAMLAGFCSAARADQFERDLSARMKGTAGELAFARAIEKVRNCGRLKADRGAAIEAGFAKLR